MRKEWYAKIWEKSVLGRGNKMQKGPRERAFFWSRIAESSVVTSIFYCTQLCFRGNDLTFAESKSRSHLN